MNEERGLSAREVEALRRQHGWNELEEGKHATIPKILWRQVKSNFVIYLLIVGMIASFFVDHDITGYAILGIIVIVILSGFFQEYKAERAVQELKRMIVQRTLVIRDGIREEVPSRELVPGDIILLHNGERVPADCLVVEERELRVDESVLTGESREMKKSASRDVTTVTAEQSLFMGTFIVSGRGVARVVKTGMTTEFGKISGLISHAEKSHPLEKKVNKIAEYMTIVAIVVCVLTLFVTLTRSLPLTTEKVIEAVIVVIALCVAAFPEGLPVILIMTLASGAHRMAKKNAIVNRMSVIEALGETTVICSDKTGTITKGEMTVKTIIMDGRTLTVSGTGYDVAGAILEKGMTVDASRDAALGLLVKTAVACNDANLRRDGSAYRVAGSSTENALLVMAAKAGVTRETSRAERLEENPFSSHRKLMSVLEDEGDRLVAYAKGAPEILVKHCVRVQSGKVAKNLDETARVRILAAAQELSRKGYRTIGLAYKEAGSVKERLEEGLTFLGIVGIEDPPREEVANALSTCLRAGIKVKMLTGDSLETAKAIAKEIGLEGGALDGDALDRLNESDLSRALEWVSVFARVRPEHKIRIVNALKERGEVVTMTGDGVNDAPALKEAHVGVAMGLKGTDVARDTADIVLKDDNFATIVDAVGEGRTIFSNIQKFTTYQLSINIAQLGLIFFALLLGLPLPLVALQILFMNLLSDEVTALTLGFAPASLDVMKNPPRRNAQIISKETLTLLFTAAGMITVGALAAFSFTLLVARQPLATARTVALVTIVLYAIVNAFNFRSLRSTIIQLPLFANKPLVYASFLSIALTVAIIYTPLNVVFETTPIPFSSWLFAAVLASTLALAFDGLKLHRHLRQRRAQKS